MYGTWCKFYSSFSRDRRVITCPLRVFFKSRLVFRVSRVMNNRCGTRTFLPAFFRRNKNGKIIVIHNVFLVDRRSSLQIAGCFLQKLMYCFLRLVQHAKDKEFYFFFKICFIVTRDRWRDQGAGGEWRRSFRKVLCVGYRCSKLFGFCGPKGP